MISRSEVEDYLTKDPPGRPIPVGFPPSLARYASENWPIRGLVPQVDDHRKSGFRAALKCIALPPRPHVLDVGAGGFVGQTTTVHLLDVLDARLDAVEIKADRARALQQRFKENISVFTQDFTVFEPDEPYDLIVLELDSNLLGVQYEQFLPLAARMLRRPEGKVICSIIYNSAEAFNESADFLNPASRPDYDAFLTRYFGSAQLEPEILERKMSAEGFAVLGMVDKFMGDGMGGARRNAIGWLVLQLREASTVAEMVGAEVEADFSPQEGQAVRSAPPLSTETPAVPRSEMRRRISGFVHALKSGGRWRATPDANGAPGTLQSGFPGPATTPALGDVSNAVGADAMTDVMLCRSRSYAKFDTREHLPGKILAASPGAGADAPDDGPQVSELFEALADPGYWTNVARLTLGKSMHGWLPPALLRALLQAGEIAAGRRLTASAEEAAEPAAPQRIETALGRWIAATARRVASGAELLDAREFGYLVVSGGHRTCALTKVLHGIAPGKRFASIADVGAGIGMISLLLAAEPSVAVRSVCLVEPTARYVRPAEVLWTLAAGDDLSFEFQQVFAQNASLGSGRDLIFFGQCFYLIDESQRLAVLAAVSQALAEGGYLIVNEAVRSPPATPDPAWDKRYPDCLSMPRLVEELSTIGEVSVLRRTSEWQRPEEPLSLGAAEIGLDSFFVVGRR